MQVKKIINDPRGSRIGVSAAASWAWGTSLFLGMEIAQTRGVVAFLIWSIANVLTLALFGELIKRKIINVSVFDNSIIKSVAMVIQMFCLVIQLNIINNTLGDFISDTATKYIITTAIGISMTMLVFSKGLPASVKMDKIKWAIAMGCCFSIIAIGLICGQEINVFPSSTASDISWGVWSAAILLSGPIGDVQHWQRAIADYSGKAYRWGSLYFAVYMAAVFGMAFFKFNTLMSVLLLVGCLMITVSTINSIAVAMHEIHSKKTGAAITVFICLAWGIFINIGIADLWSNFGIVRVTLAIVIVISSLVVASIVKGGAVNDKN